MQRHPEMKVRLRHKGSRLDEPPVQRQGILIPRRFRPNRRQPMQRLGIEGVDVEGASVVPRGILGPSLLLSDFAHDPVRFAGYRAARGQRKGAVKGRLRFIVLLHTQEHRAEQDSGERVFRFVLDQRIAMVLCLGEPGAGAGSELIGPGCGALHGETSRVAARRAAIAYPVGFKVRPREEEPDVTRFEGEGLVEMRGRRIQPSQLVQRFTL